MAELAAAAAAAYSAPDANHVVPAPGTQILLAPLFSLVAPGVAAILGPTYSGHGRAAALCGHRTIETGDFAALSDAGLAVVVNPNNPDGRVVARRDLLELAGTLRRKGGLLVVDEAFMDVGPRAQSLAGDVDEGGIVVLRSFGKFFGLAGVRLGFAIASQPIAQRLEAGLGPWCGFRAGARDRLAALADTAWQERTRRRLAAEAERLDDLLMRHGVEVDGGTSLFRHVAMPAAQSVFQALGKRGILLRNFADRPNELRAGLPGSEEGWQRLEAALAAWAGQVAWNARRAGVFR